MRIWICATINWDRIQNGLVCLVTCHIRICQLTIENLNSSSRNSISKMNFVLINTITHTLQTRERKLLCQPIRLKLCECIFSAINSMALPILTKLTSRGQRSSSIIIDNRRCFPLLMQLIKSSMHMGSSCSSCRRKWSRQIQVYTYKKVELPKVRFIHIRKCSCRKSGLYI